MSTIETATGCKITVGPKGLALWDRSAHLIGYELSTPLTADERRALADALDPGRDFSGVDWKTMFEHEIRNRVAAVALLRRERDEALRKKGEAFDRAVRAERERDAAVARAEQAERERAEIKAEARKWIPAYSGTTTPSPAVSIADIQKVVADVEMVRQTHGFNPPATRESELVRRLWALHEGTDRPASAVSRADIEKALRECTNDVFASHAYPHMADAVCAMFGIEAEQAVDPVEDKAIELHQVAYGGRIGFGHATLNAQEMFRILARHVLGQEATR